MGKNKKDKNKKNEALKNIGLLIISLLVSLIFIEFVISHFFPQDLQKYRLDENIGYRPMENTATRLRGHEFDIISRTNSKGLLDYEQDYNF